MFVVLTQKHTHASRQTSREEGGVEQRGSEVEGREQQFTDRAAKRIITNQKKNVYRLYLKRYAFEKFRLVYQSIFMILFLFNFAAKQLLAFF